VIVDATFRRCEDADAFAEFVPHAAWIVCEAPREVMLERARMRALRGDSVSDAGPEIVAAELDHHPRIEPPSPELARLETTRPVAELLRELASALDRGAAGARR
jgi:predicted kinase